MGQFGAGEGGGGHAEGRLVGRPGGTGMGDIGLILIPLLVSPALHWTAGAEPSRHFEVAAT